MRVRRSTDKIAKGRGIKIDKNWAENGDLGNSAGKIGIGRLEGVSKE